LNSKKGCPSYEGQPFFYCINGNNVYAAIQRKKRAAIDNK